jgi:hypothetical protein
MYAYSICEKIKGDRDIDQTTVFSNFPIYDMNHSLKVLYRKYMGENIPVGDDFSKNKNHANDIIVRITRLYEQLIAGNRDGISTMIRTHTDVNKLIEGLVKLTGDFKEKHEVNVIGTKSSSTPGDFSVHSMTETKRETHSIKPILPSDR